MNIKEQVAEWIYKWYQGGCAWVDLPETVKLRYLKNATDLLSLISAEIDKALLTDKQIHDICRGTVPYLWVSTYIEMIKRILQAQLHAVKDVLQNREAE